MSLYALTFAVGAPRYYKYINNKLSIIQKNDLTLIQRKNFPETFLLQPIQSLPAYPQENGTGRPSKVKTENPPGDYASTVELEPLMSPAPDVNKSPETDGSGGKNASRQIDRGTAIIDDLSELGVRAAHTNSFVMTPVSAHHLKYNGYNNSCFFNAGLTYLAHTLTDDELTAIEGNTYIKKSKSLDNDKENFKKFTAELVNFIRKVKHGDLDNISQEGLYEQILTHAKKHKIVKLIQILPKDSLENCLCNDAVEFISAILEIFSYENNPGACVNGHPVLAVYLPEEATFKQQGITSMDQLLKYHRVQEGISYTRKSPLQHISMQIGIFTFDGENTQKIHGVSHRLLIQNQGTINLPIRVADQREKTVVMEPDAMLFHKGSSLTGHYIEAYRMGTEWFIYNSYENCVHELKPSKVEGYTPMEALMHYSDENDMDPYLVHYRRRLY